MITCFGGPRPLSSAEWINPHHLDKPASYHSDTCIRGSSLLTRLTSTPKRNTRIDQELTVVVQNLTSRVKLDSTFNSSISIDYSRNGQESEVATNSMRTQCITRL